MTQTHDLHQVLHRNDRLTKDHPFLSQKCAICGVKFYIGDWTTLIPVGPGMSPIQRENARQGLSYERVSILAHWACVTGFEE